jgi:hypothetical protein
MATTLEEVSDDLHIRVITICDGLPFFDNPSAWNMNLR